MCVTVHMLSKTLQLRKNMIIITAIWEAICASKNITGNQLYYRQLNGAMQNRTLLLGCILLILFSPDRQCYVVHSWKEICLK